MLLQGVAGLAALWLVFCAPPIGPVIREQGWENVPWAVPAAIGVMLICWLLARRETRHSSSK